MFHRFIRFRAFLGVFGGLSACNLLFCDAEPKVQRRDEKITFPHTKHLEIQTSGTMIDSIMLEMEEKKVRWYESELMRQGFRRIDEEILNSLDFPMEKNVIHDTLRIQGGIESMRVYFNQEKEESISVFRLGDRLCGHPEIVHGGLI